MQSAQFPLSSPMRLAARRLLGATPEATPAEIRAAFAARARDAHPDAGGSGGDIQQLKLARDLLLSDATPQCLPNDQDATRRPCQMCSGSGRVAVGFGNECCTTCGGEGQVSC